MTIALILHNLRRRRNAAGVVPLPDPIHLKTAATDFLHGGGETGALIRA